MKRSEVDEAKWSGMKWSDVKWREVQLGKGGGERVSMEKVYKCSKGWEVKDWGEIVSELMVGK
jgi:hypothetical protein